MNEIAEVKECEERLRIAMLAGDALAISDLMDDRLIFTAPDGSVLRKHQYKTHKNFGSLKLSKIDFIDASLHSIDDMVLSTTKVDLTGSYGAAEFIVAFAYTRLWSRSSGEWRVIAGHASTIS